MRRYRSPRIQFITLLCVEHWEYAARVRVDRLGGSPKSCLLSRLATIGIGPGPALPDSLGKGTTTITTTWTMEEKKSNIRLSPSAVAINTPDTSSSVPDTYKYYLIE